MPLSSVILIVLVLFAVAFKLYGRLLRRRFDLQDSRKTPAYEFNDGVDFIPTKRGFLLGQHFSAIAAAGPIVGPILAGLWFGWLPVLLWIIFGTIFFGAVHDFSSLIGSIRHRAGSIVEIVHRIIGRRGYLLFLAFVWLSLMYVITAFTDLTSGSFVMPDIGGGVAASSMLYLLLGIVLGICLKMFRMPLPIATAIFVPLVLGAIWVGQRIPVTVPAIGGLGPQQVWNILLLGYCVAASVVPVWLLLQPRGYLGGIFLYGTLIAGFIGLLIGGETITYPAFLGFHSDKGIPLFPFLFVTVACGACSGFHGIVCSGTTSKQIDKESDCHAVGYGGMLLEGLVAIIALSTVMVLTRQDALIGASPDRIYAEGLGRFVEHLGISRDFARSFTLLAFTTFIYDTLDVATRLARYLFQELTGLKGVSGRMVATVASVLIPLVCVTMKVTDASGAVIPAWKVFWTVFGTSNQLLAALSLLALTVWLVQSKGLWQLTFLPMIGLTVMTFWSLGHMIYPAILKLFSVPATVDFIGLIAFLLLALAVLLIIESLKAVFKKPLTQLQ